MEVVGDYDSYVWWQPCNTKRMHEKTLDFAGRMTELRNAGVEDFAHQVVVGIVGCGLRDWFVSSLRSLFWFLWSKHLLLDCLVGDGHQDPSTVGIDHTHQEYRQKDDHCRIVGWKTVFFFKACLMEILMMVEASRKHPGLPNFFHQQYNTSMKELFERCDESNHFFDAFHSTFVLAEVGGSIVFQGLANRAGTYPKRSNSWSWRYIDMQAFFFPLSAGSRNYQDMTPHWYGHASSPLQTGSTNY